MQTSSIAIFRRLLSRFARPYTARICVGVVAGMIVGGTVIGVLSSISTLLQLFDPARAVAMVQAPPVAEAAAADPAAMELPYGLERAIPVLERLGITIPDMENENSVLFAAAAAAALVAFYFLRAIANFINHYTLRWVAARVVTDIRNSLFETLQKQSLAYYGTCDVGQLISRCTYDTSRVESAISKTVGDVARAPFEIVGALAFVVHYATKEQLGGMVFSLLLLLPLCFGPVIWLGRRLRRFSRKALGGISLLVSRMQENFTCIRVVKAFNMGDEEVARFKSMSEDYFHEAIRALRAEILMAPAVELMAVLGVAVLVVACAINGVVLARIFPFAVAALFAYRPFKQLAKVNAGLQRSSAAAERLFEILDTDTSLPEDPDGVPLIGFEERILFEHVDFAYNQGATQVLTDVCLTIPKGSVVAFVGETGSGKTTVANLLARFYDPTAGTVTMDGTDLRHVNTTSLRELIGIVTQETVLFNDTIARNIAYGTHGATMDDIMAAATKANAHDFIVAEPEGYERVVGEKGFVLSGGQRQRVAIARAILKNPPVLILDEATSALDTATEQLVQEAIGRVMEDRTVFAIAHRLSTIRHADQIVVLDRGRIIERGTHDELYAAGGRYRELCDLQFS